MENRIFFFKIHLFPLHVKKIKWIDLAIADDLLELCDDKK